MSGAKVKNIVILLLFVVDLALLGVFGVRMLSDARLERQAAADAAAALERLGMEAPKELLQQKQEPLYPLEEERNVTAECALAEQLLGSFALESQGGGLYTAENDRGRLRLSSAGIFELVLYPPYPAGVRPDLTPAELLVLCGAGERITLMEGAQMLRGVRVFDRDVTLRETSEGLVVSGGLLAGEIYVSDGSPSKSLTAALLALAGERKNDVTGETETVLSAEPGYVAELVAENYTALRPVWRITTDRGTYTVDALRLEVLDS